MGVGAFHSSVLAAENPLASFASRTSKKGMEGAFNVRDSEIAAHTIPWRDTMSRKAQPGMRRQAGSTRFCWCAAEDLVFPMCPVFSRTARLDQCMRHVLKQG